MKFLIAGVGSVGRRHLHNLHALGEDDILLYRTRLGALSDEDLVGLPVEVDLQAALDRKPGAVIISNPTALHLGVAIPAAEAGCHLLIEKPLSNTLDGVEQLCSAVERGGGRVLVGYHFRFHPGLRRIKRLLEENSVGLPISFRAHWGEYLPDWHPWEDYRRGYSARRDLGGGAILTLSHPFDYSRWLFGEVETVWAFTSQSCELDLDVETAAEVGLRFADGTLGSIHLNYTQKPPSHSLEIVCTRGVIRWSYEDGLVHVYSGHGEAPETYPSLEGTQRNQLFRSEMEHFLALTREETQPACTLDDGIEALKISLGALESTRAGQSWTRT